MVSMIFFILTSFKLRCRRVILAFGLLVSGFFLWSHRTPDRGRVTSSVYVSPVDGRVDNIEREDDEIFISVYLGLTDVHTVKSPIKGTISNVERECGYNFPALMTELSEKNNSLSFIYENGDKVTVYTGILARRLINEIKCCGEDVNRGDDIGFISFGSRSTLHIKKSNIGSLEISEGDRLVSGKTVIGSQSN